MGEVTTIGLDIAKSVFQAHGADASGAVVFRKKWSVGGQRYDDARQRHRRTR
jgi:transposase